MNTHKRLWGLLALILYGAGLFAQTPQAFERAAQAAFESKDYYSAFHYYEKVMEMEPKRIDVKVRYADAARLYGAYRNAETHYQQALDADPAAGGLFLQAIYGLAVVKKHLAKYDEALALFQRFAARPDSDPNLRKKANAEIVDCEWAMERITNPDLHIELKVADSKINTGDSEMGAFRLGDTLYYGAMRLIPWGDKHVPARPLFQIMAQTGDQDPVPAWFNAPRMHTVMPAFSPDGSVMVTPYGQYADETTVDCALFIRFRNPQTRTWSAPQPLPAEINIAGYTATQPCIATRKDGYYDLYYVSDAPGGMGGKDLWRVRFSAQGVFSQPENLRQLNTESDEVTPWFDGDRQTLYFSSTGYQNIGGFDVYKSTWSNNRWSTPKHLPAPINSSYDDLFYSPVSEEWANLTSNRLGAAQVGEESCCYDLFSVRTLPIKLQTFAFEEGTDAPLSEVVFALFQEQKPPFTKFSALENSARFDVKRDQKYTIIASKEGYFPDTVSLTATIESHRRLLTENLRLRPMNVDLTVRVFHEWTREPLADVNIRLLEITGTQLDLRNTGLVGNESPMSVQFRRSYRIIAEKAGFAADTTVVTEEELSKPGAKVIKNLFLTPASLYGLLPLAIYFDNNVPPRQPATSIESYDMTFEDYMSRREFFIEEFTRHIEDESEKALAVERLNAFFDGDVQNGFSKLEHFADNLDLFLGNGFEVEIMVKGFASPLASHEYNLALTKRRIVSVQNYLKKAKGGVYESFIQQKQLRITTAPLGETQAAQGVTDNRKNKQQSVFSVEASKERRAEIIEVKLTRIQPLSSAPVTH